jgi:hypothetical protein
MLVEQWGTEIALMIVTVCGSFVVWLASSELKRHKFGQWFSLLTILGVLLSWALYFALRLDGINP